MSTNIEAKLQLAQHVNKLQSILLNDNSDIITSYQDKLYIISLLEQLNDIQCAMIKKHITNYIENKKILPQKRRVVDSTIDNKTLITPTIQSNSFIPYISPFPEMEQKLIVDYSFFNKIKIEPIENNDFKVNIFDVTFYNLVEHDYVKCRKYNSDNSEKYLVIYRKNQDFKLYYNNIEIIIMQEYLSLSHNNNTIKIVTTKNNCYMFNQLLITINDKHITITENNNVVLHYMFNIKSYILFDNIVITANNYYSYKIDDRKIILSHSNLWRNIEYDNGIFTFQLQYNIHNYNISPICIKISDNTNIKLFINNCSVKIMYNGVLKDSFIKISTGVYYNKKRMLSFSNIEQILMFMYEKYQINDPTLII